MCELVCVVSSRPVVTSDRAEQRVAAGKRHVRVGEKRRREGEGNTGNISSSLGKKNKEEEREREECLQRRVQAHLLQRQKRFMPARLYRVGCITHMKASIQCRRRLQHTCEELQIHKQYTFRFSRNNSSRKRPMYTDAHGRKMSHT